MKIFRVHHNSNSRLIQQISPKPSHLGRILAPRKIKKRAASFVPSRKTNRPWLAYVEGQGMYCTVYQKAEKRPFDRDTWNKIPATRLRLESIKSHENCVAHKDAVRQLDLVAQCETIPGIVQPDALRHE